MSTKFALVVGCNYTGTNNALLGCINDSIKWKDFFEQRGYTVTLINDDTLIKPTRRIILIELMKLVTSDGTHLAFCYSGHGGHQLDISNDEDDGQDENILPLDFQEKACIFDDTLRAIVDLVLPNQKMFCILDCCHSGTGLDLKYNMGLRLGSLKYEMTPSKKSREDTPAHVVCVSGCTDSTTSADAWIDSIPQGALTANLHKVLTENKYISYENMMKKTTDLLTIGGYTQRARFSSGRPMNLNNLVTF